MVGSPADMSKAEELFLKLDQNSDGYISQEEFITIVKQDHNLLNILQNKSYEKLFQYSIINQDALEHFHEQVTQDSIG